MMDIAKRTQSGGGDLKRWLSAGALALVALAAAGCAAPQSGLSQGGLQDLPSQNAAPAQPAPDWRLAQADLIAGDQYLILTIPMDTPEALVAAAADIEARYGVVLAAEWPLASIAVHCLVIDAQAHGDIDALAEQMRTDPEIRTVQRMQSFESLGVAYPGSLAPMQEGLRRINALQAHVISRGAGVRVGVVDTGIDAGHPDLAQRLELSRDFVGKAEQPDGELHGTAIAGVIAADGTRRKGMVGVAPEAAILGLRACWQDGEQESGRCSSFSLARAINFAILNDVDVLNLSLGGPQDPLLQELITGALNQGMLVVAAWGEQAQPAFPASMAGVIGVAGTPDSQSAEAVMGPAVDILSTSPNGGYRYFSGSSVAAAHISGVAALLKAYKSDLSQTEVARAINKGAKVAASGNDLDACAALRSISESSITISCN
jgi:subtilisin family serine protease